MKAAEILRSLADVIDRAESGTTAAEVPKQVQAPKFHKVEVSNDEQGDPYSTMTSPLQQKLELLKKAAGVESAYDDDEECGCDGADPLDQMKKMAGIQVVAQAGEDAGE